MPPFGTRALVREYFSGRTCGSSPKVRRPVNANLMQTIGDQIRTIRKALGMTQDQLAERSRLTQSVIAGIETGRRGNPSFATITKLAEALNCTFISRLSPKQEIPVFLEEQSDRLARKIVAISTGSSAIEFQSPSRKTVEEEIRQIKKDLLGKHKSALWQRI